MTSSPEPELPPQAPPTGPYFPPPQAPPAAPYAAPPAGPYAQPAPYFPPAGFPQQAAPERSALQQFAGQARSHAVAAGSAVRGAAARVDTTRVASVAGQVGRTTATHAGQVGRTTLAHTGRAARRTVSAVAEFGVGLGAFWQGLWTFLTSPLLWLYAVLPAAAVYGLTFAGRAGADVAVEGLAGWAGGFADGWWGVLRWAFVESVRWGATGLAYMLIGFLVVPLTLIIGAPFLVLIVRRTEKNLGGPASSHGLLRSSGFVMTQTLLVTLTVAFGGAILAPILLIPGINVLVAVAASVLVNGFVIGLLAAGPPLHHRGVSERMAHVRHAWRRRWPTLGFGTMSVLVLSIPFAPLRWFTIPAVFVGAVLLNRRFPANP